MCSNGFDFSGVSTGCLKVECFFENVTVAKLSNILNRTDAF